MKKFDFQELNFKSGQNNLKGYLYCAKDTTNSSMVLFIHGSGKRIGAKVFQDWQTYLVENGISSFSFDCRGVGGSEGEFDEGSLNNRLIDAESALDTFLDLQSLNNTQLLICGISMGAHVAIRLIEKQPNIRGLILEGAAAYSREAEDKKLDSEFSAVIQQENNWELSPIFSILKNLKIPTILFYGDKDSVIPEGVKDRYGEIAGEDSIITLPNANHSFIVPTSSIDKNNCQEMFEKSLEFIKRIIKDI